MCWGADDHLVDQHAVGDVRKAGVTQLQLCQDAAEWTSASGMELEAEQGSHPTPCSCTGSETRHRTSSPVSLHPAEHEPQLPAPNIPILLSKQEDENPNGTRESWKPQSSCQLDQSCGDAHPHVTSPFPGSDPPLPCCGFTSLPWVGRTHNTSCAPLPARRVSRALLPSLETKQSQFLQLSHRF